MTAGEKIKKNLDEVGQGINFRRLIKLAIKEGQREASLGEFDYWRQEKNFTRGFNSVVETFGFTTKCGLRVSYLLKSKVGVAKSEVCKSQAILKVARVAKERGQLLLLDEVYDHCEFGYRYPKNGCFASWGAKNEDRIDLRDLEFVERNEDGFIVRGEKLV